MNLAKAMKVKNRLVQKISSLREDIQRYNSYPTDLEQKIDVKSLMIEQSETVKSLIKLKLLIFQASAPMRETILKISEAKSNVSFLRSIDTFEGKGKTSSYNGLHFGGSYDKPEIEFTAAYDIVWVKDQIKNEEEEIDRLQDELDAFNHKTEIDFDI
jgi:hypothetical protein